MRCVRRFKAAAPALLLAAVVLAIYGRTLTGYFLGDDFGYVSLYAGFPLHRWPKLFVQEWSQGIWGFRLPELRPMPALSFILDGLIWRGNPVGYRGSNLLLHLGCSYLVFEVGARLLRLQMPMALAAALLFAVHPCHVEPVVWITGRVDLLPTAFCLGGLLAFARFRENAGLLPLAASYLCYIGAAFSKEYGLVLPLLIAAYDLSRCGGSDGSATPRVERWASRALPYLGYLTVLAIYYVCRRTAFDAGLATPGRPAWGHIAAQQIEYWRHLLAFDRITAGQIFSWRPAASLERLTAFAAGALFLMTLSAVLLGMWRRSRGYTALRLLFCGPIWFLVTTAPFIITYISPRHLYLTSAGFCLFVAAMIGGATAASRRRWFYGVIALLALVWSYDAYRQTRPWQRAGSMTKRVVAEIRQLANTPPRTVLIMQLPASHEGAHILSWSSPFLFDRPFLKKSLRKRLIVLETPPTYYWPERWNDKREIERLGELPGEIVAFDLTLDAASQNLDVRRLDGERVREAGKVLHSEVLRDPAQDSMGLWEQFRAGLSFDQ
jgi:hypothetical protein